VVAKAAGVLSWPAVRSAAVLAGIVLLALFLRTYRLEIMTIGDTYEQLAATGKLLSADFPISKIYPAGVAVIMAAPMSVLPRTTATVEGIVLVCSVALVVTAYVATRKTTGDVIAATALSLAIACSPRMVFYARIEFFDAINALAIVLAVFVVPALRGRAVAVFIAYAAALAVIVSIRATNIVVLPAIIIYWIDPGRRWPASWDWARALLRKEIIVAVATFVACSAVLALVASSVSQASNAPYSAQGYPGRVAFYEIFVFSDYAAILVLPLAALGAVRLWKRNPTVVLVSVYIALAWPASHAVVPFFNDRYMLPAVYFGSFLAAHGASDAIRRSAGRAVLRATCVTILLGFVASQLAVDAYLLKGWPDRAATGYEAAFREMRPRIGGLRDGSLIVTAQAGGLRYRDRHVEYLDLVNQSIPGGVNDRNIQTTLQSIRAAQNEGREVYYMYSDIEDGAKSERGLNYYSYFTAVEGKFSMTEIYRAVSMDKFRLYRVGAPRPH